MRNKVKRGEAGKLKDDSKRAWRQEG